MCVSAFAIGLRAEEAPPAVDTLCCVERGQPCRRLPLEDCEAQLLTADANALRAAVKAARPALGDSAEFEISDNTLRVIEPFDGSVHEAYLHQCDIPVFRERLGYVFPCTVTLEDGRVELVDWPWYSISRSSPNYEDPRIGMTYDIRLETWQGYSDVVTAAVLLAAG